MCVLVYTRRAAAPNRPNPPALVVCHVERAHDDSGARAGKDLRWGVAEGVLERPHVRHGVFRRQLRDDLVQHVGLLPGVLPHAARVVHHLYFFSQRWRAKVSGSDTRRARERGVCVWEGGEEHHSQWRRRRSTRRTPRSWCRWQSRPPCTARRPVGEDGKSRKGQHKGEREIGRSGGGGGGSPLTKAECDEGIPPEPTRRVRSHFLSRYLWGSSARAKEKGCRRSKGERERERERERESASVLGLLLVVVAQPSPFAAAAAGARERTKQTTYHVVKTLAICANKKERSAATRGLGARATSTRLMMWPGGSSSANRSANRGQQKPTRLRAVP